MTIVKSVDAEQFWPDKLPWPENVKVQDADFWGGKCLDEDGKPNFYYFDGEYDAYQISPGDWIITSETGYQWSWSTSILKTRYRPVDDCPDWDLTL